MERVGTTKLLGTYIHEHLKWEVKDNFKDVSSSLYSTLTTLRKLKNCLPFNMHP